MRACLAEVGPAPEVPGLGSQNHTTDPECAEKWEVCMDQAAAIRLAQYIGAAQRWIRDAVTQCEAEPKEGSEDEITN